jgi:hypothetical protein
MILAIMCELIGRPGLAQDPQIASLRERGVVR